MDPRLNPSIIVAIASNYTIGNNNKLPWRGQLPADMRHFQEITWDHPIIMGRKTFESLGKPLDGRINIVLSRNTEFKAAGCTVVRDLGEAFAVAEGNIVEGHTSRPAFIIGGAEVYRQALVLSEVDTIYLTLVHQDFPGDTRFPHLNIPSEWQELERQDHQADEKNQLRYSFITLIRRLHEK